MHEANTYKAQLATAAARLKAAGLDRPGREARLLMQHACGLSAAELIRDEDDEIDPDLRAAFFDLVERRATHEPFEYLTGEAHFYGLDFVCSPATLIPRADSEVVVDEALARLPLGREASVADLGTGTGCLLIALMKNHPGLTGIGIEKSPEAAAIARQNVTRHGLDGRAGILAMDWRDHKAWSTPDLIISNPPYIRTDVLKTLAPGVRDHEPIGALDGGQSGLDAYNTIINLVNSAIRPETWLVFEIGYDQGPALTDLLRQLGFGTISCHKDKGMRDRVVCARRVKRSGGLGEEGNSR